MFFENDGNAGALAELLNGVGVGLESYLYLHIGTFIGGGLVLRGQLEEGRHGNAAAIASMPLPAADASCDVPALAASIAALAAITRMLTWTRVTPARRRNLYTSIRY